SLMDLFRVDAESQTAALSEGLLALEGSGGGSPETFEPLMRAAHSLKGAARIVGLDPAVRIAHAMEDGFVAAQKGRIAIRPEHVDVLLRAVDLLNRISQLPEDHAATWAAENEEIVAAMVADLTAIQSGAPAVSQTPAPAGTPEPPEA